MTRRRWIADEVSGQRASLVGPHAQHLVRVLRARVGQEFDIATPSGVFRGRIINLEADRADFELGEELMAPLVADLSLLISIFKFDRMEWAIEKCTELGVGKFIPVAVARSEKHLVAAAAKRAGRWQRIAKQASEQSRRVAPPEVLPPMKLKEAIALSASTRIVLAESEEGVMLGDALQSHPAAGSLLLAIGPEGGWTEAELATFRDAGWMSASLGATILRAETAAIAAVAISLALLETQSSQSGIRS